MRVIYASAARLDLLEIAAWIAEDNPVRAESFAEELIQACDKLADMPHRFQLVPGHEESGIRRRPWGNYLMYYRVGDDSVQILHVLHGARDYEKILFPDD